MNHQLLDKKLSIKQQLFKPISIEECYIHRNTSIIGKPIKDSKVCACCGLKYQKQEVDCMFQPTDIYYLGSGFALYFVFIKVTVIVIFLSSLSFSGANLYFNYIQNSCQSKQSLVVCSNSIYLQLSIANKLLNLKYLQIQHYIADGTIIIIFFLFQIGRKWMRDVELEAEAVLDASDYAIMLNMPTNQYDENRVRNAIAEWWDIQYKKMSKKRKRPFESFNVEFPIQKIIISYEMSSFKEASEQLQNLKQQYKEKIQDKKSKEKTDEIVKQISAIQQKLTNKQFSKNKKCIIIFRYPDQRDYILQKHENTIGTVLLPRCFNLLRFQGQRIRISKAALPTQINWDSHEIKTQSKFLARIFIKIFVLALIVGAQAGVYGLLQYWFTNKSKTTSSFSTFISPLISVAINLINILLYKILIYISKFQYRPTTLEQKVSIALKITISVFLNSGIMLMAAYFLLDMTSIWTQGGFVQTMTYSFMISVIMPHIMKYINFDWILNAYRRLSIKCSDSTQYKQKEANQVFERINVQIYQKYAWMINMVWWASIFSPLIPIAYPCVFLSMFIHYWNQKFQHVVLVRQPKPFGSYLNKQMMNLLEMTPLFLAIGNLGMNIIITNMRHESIQLGPLIFDLIAVGVSLLIFVFPTQQLNRLISCILCINNQHQVPNKPYCQSEKQFGITYEMENPVYKQESIAKRKASQLINNNYKSNKKIQNQPIIFGYNTKINHKNSQMEVQMQRLNKN